MNNSKYRLKETRKRRRTRESWKKKI